MSYRIAALGGDGIGPEVLAEGVRVLQAVSGPDLALTFEHAEVGAALYRRTGEDLPREVVDLCRSADAILFGAAGLPVQWRMASGVGHGIDGEGLVLGGILLAGFFSDQLKPPCVPVCSAYPRD